MQEYKVLLFIIEKEFEKSQTIELYLKSDDVEKFLKETIKKDYRITQIERIKQNDRFTEKSNRWP